MKHNKPSLEQFAIDGYANLGSVVDPRICTKLLSEIRSDQEFSSEIFLDEKSFLTNPEYTGVNPVPGRNILEQYEELASSIEGAAVVESFLADLLGEGHYIIRKKVICGVPEKWMPGWVLERIRKNSVNNLGAYIKPEYRNITYFYGIDFHQDIIDLAGRELDFITLYVYLHDVVQKDAPLILLPGSHQFGVDKFPHELSLVDESEKKWRYVNSESGSTTESNQLVITGNTGNVALWHPCMLHGTHPNYGDEERISLRYLIAKDPDINNTFLDQVNEGIAKTKFENSMRVDQTKDCEPCMKKNYLFEQYQSRKT